MVTAAMSVNNPPLISFHLYGELAEKFGDCIKLAVRNVAEAVRLLEANFPGEFYRRIKDGSYYITHGSKVWDEGKGLGELEIALKIKTTDVHIVPVVQGGSTKGGIFQIVLGVVLIGAAFVLSGGLAAPGLLAGFSAMSGTIWGTVAAIGGALALGGVVQLISPQPKTSLSDPQSDQKSTLFGGPINAGNQGVCVPVIYGRAICGTVIMGAGIHLTSSGAYTSNIGSLGNATGAAYVLGPNAWIGNAAGRAGH